MADKPTGIELYAYNVYFGDCFLMLFKYANDVQKSVLIDFGSTGKGKKKKGETEVEIEEGDEQNNESTGKRLLKIAQHIQSVSGGKLDVIVATHRHKDHIYGFGLKEAGQIILECTKDHPTIVVQPWTEDPEDNRDLSGKKSKVDDETFKADPVKSFAAMLGDMHAVAESVEAEIHHLDDGNKFTKTVDQRLKERIVFAADDNKIKNRAAVENLQKMSSDPHYVYYGYDKIDWEKILPGVKVHVLGPPNLAQSDEIMEATTKSGEFWSLQAMTANFWATQAATSRLTTKHIKGDELLFNQDKVLDLTSGQYQPSNIRWFIRQLRSLRAGQLLEIVKFVDDALNNTSVILLFETGDQKLLFPGDAQIENWQYALKKAQSEPQLQRLLDETTVYKVGHHGSRNATPKSLWKNFKNVTEGGAEGGKTNRLKTVVSTMRGKHGESEDTFVPLPKMVKEMRAKSDYHSTEEIEEGFFELIKIKIG